jgi:hypothetical protein
VNTYFSLVLSSMPGHKKRGQRTYHGPRPGTAVVRPRDGDNTHDEASDIASVDCARDMSTSFAREGSGGFDSSEGSGGFDSHRQDRDPSPFPAARVAARGGFGTGRRNGTSSPSPAPSGGAARGGDPEERGRIWKKSDFPTDDDLRKCHVHRHEDLPRHIYLLLDILGLQFRWVLTRVGMAARSSPQPNALWTTKRSTPGWLCTRTTVTFSKPCSIATFRHCGTPALTLMKPSAIRLSLKRFNGDFHKITYREEFN